MTSCAAILLDTNVRCNEPATHCAVFHVVKVCAACKRRCAASEDGITVEQGEPGSELRLGLHQRTSFELIKEA